MHTSDNNWVLGHIARNDRWTALGAIRKSGFFGNTRASVAIFSGDAPPRLPVPIPTAEAEW